MRLAPVALIAVSLTAPVFTQTSAPSKTYFPPRGEWRQQNPAALGLDKHKLDEAIAFAIAHENPDTKDLAAAIPNQFKNEAPYNTLIGPTQPRAASNASSSGTVPSPRSGATRHART